MPLPSATLRFIITLALAAMLGTLASADAAEVRRVVTKLGPDGKAVVMLDSAVPLVTQRVPAEVGDIWVTDKSPPDVSSADDRGKLHPGIAPPPGGTIFRVIEFPPTPTEVEKMDVNTLMKAVGPRAPAKGLPPRHALMHRTRTLDYIVVLSGEIDMLLDDSEVHLKAGDVMVQQASNHAWVNRGKEPARVAFILIDSQEP